MKQSAVTLNHPPKPAAVSEGEDRKFWLGQFQGRLDPTKLRLDFNRPVLYSGHTQQLEFTIDPTVTHKLNELTGSDPFLTYTTLMAVFNIVLYRYTKTSTIIVGSPMLRTEVDSNETNNAVVIVNTLAEQHSFKQLLDQVRTNLLSAYQHQNYRLEWLASDLGLAAAAEQCRFFDIALVFQGLHQPLPPLKNDLTIEFLWHQSQLMAVFGFNTDLFRAATINHLSQNFTELLARVLAESNLTIGELLPLTVAERQLILMDWNQTTVPYPDNRCVHQLFEAQVTQNPQAIALRCADQTLTYLELNQRSNQLAHYLRRLGVSANQAVGLVMDRSLEMIVGLMAVLKAGGAYVPIDPTYPQERIAVMLQTIDFWGLLTRTALVDQLPETSGPVICLDRDWQQVAVESTENLADPIAVNDLCYIIFTSGSTGTPKAAAVHHQGWTNLLHWFSTEFALNERDRGLIISSFSFDITQRAIAMPLINGGQLQLLASPYYDQDLIIKTIHEQKITLLNCAPSTFYPLLENRGEAVFIKLNSLRCLFLGGEAISASRLQKWATSPQCQAKLVNVYGAAECSDVSSFYRLHDYQQYIQSSVPVGRPIHNTQIYILDDNLAPVPVGVIGEICLAGVGVGKGYINDPELTARKFVLNPFENDPAAKLYRTGDLGRMLPDGTIEFNGRVDQQIKIRGLRIELGDVESVIRQHAAIREAVVIDRKLASGEQYLVAYLVPEATRLSEGTESLISQIRHFVKGKLPAYMVPNFLVVLDELPLNPNGKIDRKALPEPEYAIATADSGSEARGAAPTLTPLEGELMAIYLTILGQTKISTEDNFFEIGGHSLMATQVISLLNEQLQVQLSLADLLTAPTIAGLAKRIERKLGA